MIGVEDVVDLVEAKLGGPRAGIVLDADSVLREIGLSSLQITDIVFTIEDRLGVEFDPAMAADVTTIGDLVALARATAMTDAGQPR